VRHQTAQRRFVTTTPGEQQPGDAECRIEVRIHVSHFGCRIRRRRLVNRTLETRGDSPTAHRG
jgi:hypothetical protein